MVVKTYGVLRLTNYTHFTPAMTELTNFCRLYIMIEEK